jgi:hypothetical protein
MHLLGTALLSVATSLPLSDVEAIESHRTPLHPFTVVAENREAAQGRNQQTFLIRSILIRESGNVVQLRHRVHDDGSLELRGADQSPETIASLDRYCRNEGLSVVTGGSAKLGRDTVSMLACGEGMESTPENVRPVHEPSVHTEALESVGGVPIDREGAGILNTSVVLSTESPGSIYKGDVGYFHIYADFEYEFGGGKLAEVVVYYMPGCGYSSSEYINKWGRLSHGFYCGTSSVALGVYQGHGTAKLEREFDRAFVATEVWRHPARH